MNCHEGKEQDYRVKFNANPPVKTYLYFRTVKNENGEIDKKSMGIIPTVLQNVLDARRDTRLKIKSETDEFKKKGGLMHGLQIWVNLPQKNKKVKPGYQHIFKDDIPTIKLEDDIKITEPVFIN